MAIMMMLELMTIMTMLEADGIMMMLELMTIIMTMLEAS
jgi:hypothetical protein